MNKFNILTSDPSITEWGYAVVSIDSEILEAGCIKTIPDKKKKNIRKSDDRVRRISEINQKLIGLIKKHDIKYMLAEAPHGSQSAVGAVMIGMVAGMNQTISDCLGIPIEFYSEGEVKKHLLNKRAATKQEMIDKVNDLTGYLHDGPKYAREAVADAIGIFLTAENNSHSLKFLKNLSS